MPAQAVIIKRYGNIVKIYASCIASLFAAGASSFVLQDPPAHLFYLGCFIAMTATLQLQKARAPDAQYTLVKGNPGHVSETAMKARKVSVGVCGVGCLMLNLVLLIFCLATRPGQAVFNTSGTPYKTAAAPKATTAHFGLATDTPMMTLPPFQPTCFVDRDDDMYKFGCPILSCDKDPSCTVDNPACCMHLHWKMLTFIDRFLESKCLQDEYLLAHGTALGAVRNKTTLYHTNDVDIAVSPLGLQFLELNSTRQELWRHGYALYHYSRWSEKWWKLGPHLHHPDPAFRAAFRAYKEDTDAWKEREGDLLAVFADLWPMWPVPNNTTSCTTASGIDTSSALWTPWDSAFDGLKNGTVNEVDTCSDRFAANSSAGSANSSGPRQQLWCTVYQAPPYNVITGSRLATVHNQSFPVATNFAR